MLVPSNEKKDVEGKKEVFYEVGCKIMEINKIIK